MKFDQKKTVCTSRNYHITLKRCQTVPADTELASAASALVLKVFMFAIFIALRLGLYDTPKPMQRLIKSSKLATLLACPISEYVLMISKFNYYYLELLPGSVPELVSGYLA